IKQLQGSGILCSFSIDEEGTILLGLVSYEECFFIKVGYPYASADVKKIRSGHINSLGIDALNFAGRIVFSEYRLVNYPVPWPKGGLFIKLVYRDRTGKVLLKDSTDINEVSPFTKLQLNGTRLAYITGNLFVSYDLASGKKEKERLGFDVISIFRKGNELLAGLRKGGVLYRNTTSPEKNGAHYLIGKSVPAIYADAYGGYWYGTLEDGVYYCPDKRHYKLPLFQAQTQKPEITSFLKLTDTTLLATTDNYELTKLEVHSDGTLKEELVYKIPEKDRSTSLIKIGSSRIIVPTAFTDNGILLELKDGAFIKLRDHLPAANRGMLAGKQFVSMAVKEIIFYDTSGFREIKRIKFNDRIKSMAYAEQKNMLYVGGMHGLYALDKDTGTFPVKLMDKRADDLLNADGLLFIATKEKGLYVKNGAVTDTIGVEQGLLSNTCRKLFYCNGECWVISNKGLSRIKYYGYNSYTIKNYPYAEYTLPESIDNITFIKDKLVFFDKGEMVFFPIDQQVLRQPVRIGRVLVNNKPVSVQGPLKLNYNESALTVEAKALFFASNKSIVYRYKFMGADSAWKYSSQPVINFPALSPGHYELTIQARDQNNTWIKCRQNLVFSIEAPYWQTWWFEGISAALILGTCVLLILRRYRAILEKERAESAVNSRLNEMEMKVLKAQMDPHFIFNALNSIQQFIIVNENEKAQMYLSKFSRLLRKLLESNTRESIRLSDEIQILEKYLEIELLRFNKVFEFRINVSQGLHPEHIHIPHYMVQPFVENAIWHGLLPKEGHKELSISFEQISNKSLSCTIEDNGIGRREIESRDASEEKKSLAINFIRQRLELMSKTLGESYTLTIIDKKNESGGSEGTRVIVLIPVLKL
ncbi:MAG: sensor histidine kinase, partial [Bacteroidia bacterium]